MENTSVKYRVNYDKDTFEFECVSVYYTETVTSTSGGPLFQSNATRPSYKYDTKEFDTLGEAKSFCFSLIDQKKQKFIKACKDLKTLVRETKDDCTWG